MLNLVILSIALLVDRIIGDPDWLWARMPHPVVLFGKAIAFFDRHFNRRGLDQRDRRSYGIMTILALVLAAILSGYVLHRLFSALGLFGLLLEIAVVAVLLAQKSLSDHVEAVARGLREGGIDGGRRAVAMVVGRDPQSLDRSGICRAAIETLAENFSDGVIAPALYYAVFGLPGLFAYKMINTADSMIGHKTERYFAFGWASARLDDLVNWPAARLSALLLAGGAWLASGSARAGLALATAWRDHGLHRSPNSGWPESAMAGAIDVALAGPRVYAGESVMEPMQNAAGRKDIGPAVIDEALTVYANAATIFNIAVPLMAIVLLLIC